MRTVAALSVALLAINIVLVGCGRKAVLPQPSSTGPKSEKTPSQTVSTLPTSTDQATELPASPELRRKGEESIRGQAMRKSDVVQDPNTPIDEAFLLAIPSEEFDLLLEEAGLSRASTNRLMSLLVLTEELFEKYVEASATSQQNGEYELKVPPGNYFLCLANLGLPRQPEVFPADVYGCIEITVPESTQLIQDIFWGEAGVTSN